MGIRIIEGVKVNEGEKPAAVLYDSVTNRALPPIFRGEEEADDFLAWLGDDPRRLAPDLLESKYVEFMRNVDILDAAIKATRSKPT